MRLLAASMAVVGLMFVLATTPTRASGVFELQIKSFRNDLGLSSNGTCCNGYRMNGICSESCHTFFKVCLAHFQADIATNPQPRCTFANFQTPVLGDNTMDFAMISDLPVQSSRQNTFYFPVTKFSWPGDFSLIIEAWHDMSSDYPTAELSNTLIARLASNGNAASGSDWDAYVHSFNYTELKYAFRFRCAENYFGPKCQNLCRPRDDEFGHYSCSQNGTKVCLPGWKGEYCDDAICSSGCHKDNGYCSEPNECKCKVGFEGQFCTDCIRYPGCQHGTCKKPWDCLCEDGWGGLFCNQDLNFCTHHKPCRNGGFCTNTGQGSYTCECVGSYAGVNCERELDDCQNMPCLNEGVCKDIGNGFQCQCPRGFYGKQCQSEALSCRNNPCMFGGSCVEQGDSYSCVCPPGFTGYNCDTEVNECGSDPCENGGSCIDQLNGYRCMCPVGFSGPECQHNENDCHHDPCQNGGTCIDMVNDFKCQCIAGYVGTLCQDNVDDCEMMPCANGGQCHDLINDFTCKCAPGFEGKDCSTQIVMCGPSHNPCQHGGVCEPSFADYDCACLEGFWGKNCQHVEGEAINNEVDTTTHQPSVAAPTARNASDTLPDPLGASGDEDEEGSALTMTQLLLIVLLGVGVPLILIILAVTFFLCRTRPYFQRRSDHIKQNLENIAKEKEQNYINNMNNKTNSKFTEVFTTTPLPSSLSKSSNLKINNDEQDEYNKLKVKQLQFASSSGAGDAYKEISPCSDMSSKLSSDCSSKLSSFSVVNEGSMHTSCSKQSFHDAVIAANTHRELPSPASISSSSSSMSNIKGANLPSSTYMLPPNVHRPVPLKNSGLSVHQGVRRSSDNEYCYDDTPHMSCLDVDSLKAEARRPISECIPRHLRDSNPRALTPQQQQHVHQLQQSLYCDDDFLATEV